jgi:uncharacterized protein (TIGR02246 family)
VLAAVQIQTTRGETMNANEEAVAAVLAKYEAALNASDTDAVMPLYAEDGVFMPPYSQSAVGAAALRKAYAAVFQAITLSVKFNVAEVVEMAPGWVFARTDSAGTTTNRATGAKSAEGMTVQWLGHDFNGFYFGRKRCSICSTQRALSDPSAVGDVS